MYLCTIATVTVHICTVTVALVFISLHFSLSPHLTLSFSASTLTSLSLLSPVPQSSLTDMINIERRKDDISAWAMTSRPWKIKTTMKLVTTWTSFEVSNSSASSNAVTHCGFWRTMLAPSRTPFSVGFWSRFSVGFRDSEKKEGSRWWESRSSKKWVRKRGWWWLMIDFLFWIYFFLFDQFWIFCLIHGFWGDGGLMMVAEWVDGGGWVGVDWFEDEYFIWINVYNRQTDVGAL